MFSSIKSIHFRFERRLSSFVGSDAVGMNGARSGSDSKASPVWWLPHPDLLWVPGRSTPDANVFAFDDGDGSTALHVNSAIVQLEQADDNAIAEDDDDLAPLVGQYHERQVLHHIRRRYRRSLVHTWIGSLLIVVNPRRPMPLYTARSLDSYLKCGSHRNKPHSFAVVAKALDNLRTRKISQWIVAVGSRKFCII